MSNTTENNSDNTSSFLLFFRPVPASHLDCQPRGRDEGFPFVPVDEEVNDWECEDQKLHRRLRMPQSKFHRWPTKRIDRFYSS